ncbi:MAG: hypothetical protein KKB62_03095 [Nanoarchaeota archaeon]|nr:hypothetical protein [Nanoarchaeota archaeon]
MNKRGLSAVVATIIIVLLVLVAVAVIWGVLNNFIFKGSRSITLGQFGIDMVIESAAINYTSGIAMVKVARNPGVSDEKVIAIIFIVEDHKNSDAFREDVGDFKVYEKRTFYLNLTTSEILNISDVYKISIVPIFISSASGIETVGPQMGGYGFGGNIQINSTTNLCTQNSDCGIDYWISGSEFCNGNGTQVLRYKKIFQCYSGFCQNTIQAFIVETCLGSEVCYAGQCISEQISCTPENVTQDCGMSGFVGFPYCYNNPPPEKIVQSYRDISCVNNACAESITEQTVELCNGTEVCGGGIGDPECFEPVECAANADCSPGEICDEGSCVPEEVALSGNVSSPWPPGVNEYFVSPNLPRIPGTINYVGYRIIFPGSDEARCLTVREFVYPNSTQYDSYIRLDFSQTNISSGDYFEIWQTSYICSTI